MFGARISRSNPAASIHGMLGKKGSFETGLNMNAF
jgi:hypothetical protein